MTNHGIRTVLHPVSDLEKATPLYTALLGAGPTADSPYYVGYDVAGQHIGLVPNSGMTGPVAYWHVDDLEATLAAATAAGAEITQPPTNVGGSRRTATVVDADGNVLGLLQD